MFTFQRKKQIRFHSMSSGTNTLYPIIHSSKLNREWIAEEKQDYKSRCPFNFKGPTAHSINRCPAIHSIMNQGYIIRAPADIAVTRRGNKLETFAPDIVPHIPTVVTHGEEVSKWLLDSAKDNTCEEVVKVNTPWRCTTNDPDLIFLVVKVPFVNETRFSAVMGVMDPRIAFEINVQLFWHEEDGKDELIKAGTPLCMYIPMNRKYLGTSFVCEDPTETDWEVEKEMAYSYASVNEASTSLTERVSKVAKILKKYYG